MRKLCLLASSLLAVTSCANLTTDTLPTDTAPGPGDGYHVHGRDLFDHLGEKVILRGVNKMNVFTDHEGASFSEIRQTGANSVRIVWATSTSDFTPSAADLDKVIGRALDNHMIPMIKLHDATGDLSRLGTVVDYWTRPEIVAVIRKYETYLLVNIGNEVGDDRVTAKVFVEAYGDAVNQMRVAGIHTPLVIDAPDFGKDIDIITATAGDLRDADPDHNLVFSVHTYWAVRDGADASYVANKLQAAVDAGVPLIVGELSQYGAYAGTASICGENGIVDYAAILQQCDAHAIGWYAWEWGPGNIGGGDPKCAVMDMTSDSKFATLKPGWASEVAVTSPYSIRNTSTTPKSIVQR